MQQLGSILLKMKATSSSIFCVIPEGIFKIQSEALNQSYQIFTLFYNNKEEKTGNKEYKIENGDFPYTKIRGSLPTRIYRDTRYKKKEEPHGEKKGKIRASKKE